VPSLSNEHTARQQHLPECRAMRYSLFGLPIALAALMACGASVPTSGDVTADQEGQVMLRTDRATYQASLVGDEGSHGRYAITLAAQLSNGLSVPLYLQRCYPDTPFPLYGVVNAEEGREAAYNPFWACVGHGEPIVLSAGKTRTDSLQVLGPNAWDGHTNMPLGDLVGRFRLSYEIGTCRRVVTCELPGGAIESNEFEVRLEP
jgi:hypothetical protein